MASARALYDQGAHARLLAALPGLIADAAAPSVSSQSCRQMVSTHPGSQGPASAGAAPGVNTSVSGWSQPTSVGAAAVAPQSTQPDRATRSTVVPSAQHRGAEAMDGEQQVVTSTGVPVPPSSHGIDSTGIRQSSGWPGGGGSPGRAPW